MKDTDWHHYTQQTQAIRAGQERSHFNEHSEAIYPTSSFIFDSAEQAAQRFAGDEDGFIYSRFSNPTVDAFEKRLALMEGGGCCVATASGMAAILSTCLGLLSAGDEIVTSRSIFGSTTVLFEKFLPRYGITTRAVSLSDFSEWEQAINAHTKMLYVETPSNPLTELVDIAQLSLLAKAHNCVLVVDNCFCSPVLQQPLALGADIVIHSATKYLDGQGRALGGAIVGDNQRVGEEIFGFLRSAGPSMSPFNAWVFIKGLETLHVRMRAHCENALLLATALESCEQVEKVYYPGLASHPQHELAQSQMQGFGGVVSFVVKGGQKQAWSLINHTQLLSITANLGDVKTTITHPASTTHSRLSVEQRQQVGIEDGLIRIAVGLESIDDIINDLLFE